MVIIRQASKRDCHAIFEIWQRGVSASLGFEANFQDGEAYFLQIIKSQDATFKVWVAENTNGKILAWQSLMPTRNNPIMRGLVAESSTYCDLNNNQKGIATQLINVASIHADKSALQYIVGTISEKNAAMRHIVDKAGWKEVGQIPGSNKPPASDSNVFVVYVAKNSI